MSELISNLNTIESCKLDIKSAIEAKGVSMSGVSFPDYATAIGSISTGGTFVTETLSVSDNGTYIPGQGVDGFSQVVVDVPQSVTGYTISNILEGSVGLVINDSTTTFVRAAALMSTSVTTVILHNCSVVSASAFANCNSLTYISLPECETISANAFYNCGLSEVYLPKCTNLWASALANCNNITTVNLPKCTSISANVFNKCINLSEVYIPVIQTIGNSTFTNCSQLDKLTMGTKNYIIPTYQARLFIGATKMNNGTGSIYVASDMYSRWIVASGWSSYASQFVSVDMSGPVLSFSDGLVYGITEFIYSDYSTFLGISIGDVTELSLPEVTKIIGVFQGAKNLSSVNLPACVSISNAFTGCSSLIYVNLPSCELINGTAFQHCTSLSEISLPACVSIFNDLTFGGCTSLRSVNLPICVSIGTGIFAGCTSLSYVSLPKLTYLGKRAFYLCSELHNIDLPVCSYIGSFAFFTDPGVSLTLTLGYSSVVTLTDPQLVGVDATISIYVPASLVDSYKADQYWSNYSSTIFPIPE